MSHRLLMAIAAQILFTSNVSFALGPQNSDVQKIIKCHQRVSRASIGISIDEQTLTLFKGSSPLKTYSISTSANGSGELLNSLKTPRGRHQIGAKIGSGAPLYTIFKARKNSGLCWSNRYGYEGDFILSRILTLHGLEMGFNLGRDALNRCVDTQQRHIYIHGTHRENDIGSPISHGCIRMKNCDIAELFELVKIGTPVLIT